MSRVKTDYSTKISPGSGKARAVGRAATLSVVVGAVLAMASLIRGWNWSEIFTVGPYVAFEAGVVVFGLFQGRARAWASWSDSWGSEILLPILGTWLYPVVVGLYSPAANLPVFAFFAVYLWLAWSILSLRTNFSVLPETRTLAEKGPYKMVRHPLYLGYSALWIVWAATARGGIVPWLWASLGVTLFVYRAFVEEKKMRMFVPGYVEYSQKVPGLLPFPRPRRRNS